MSTGQALADVATIGILAQRGAQQAELLITQLQRALDSRVTIEQAKGVLAERRRITVDAAFALLRDHARSQNLHLSDLARQVADGSTTAVELLRASQHSALDGPGPQPA
ncbi:ANTAR domain-containing protein [Actinocrinis sp.]|uniref:ANTAR domain-containing protein n=1 Tax=Actinocrinis sp. TaxID=1920516 RepID=UPI002D76F435|nr:ANTAR domain-containing protein [Actinocrinis sp.]